MGRYKVTGCIVTHNNMHSIKKTLDSLLEFTRADFKLYVVDNSSTDGTPEFIEQNYPQLELIRNAGNTGFGAGHNLVMDRLDSKYHVVINPDITVKNDAISALADYLEEHEDIGMLAPKICFPDGRMQILGKRDPKIKYLFASRLRNEEKPGRLLREYAMLDEDYTKPFDIENASGCFFMIRTELFRKIGDFVLAAGDYVTVVGAPHELHELFRKIGGFDEGYFLYFEDSDITRTVRKYARVVFDPSVVVYHEWERESKHNFKLLLVHIRSMFYYMKKWR